MEASASPLAAWCRRQALYNRLANEEIYRAAATLDDASRRAARSGSFGSIHALLNHMLLADRIWLDRFEGVGASYTPPLGTILHEDFRDLQKARATEDSRIERFFASDAAQNLATGVLRYVNSRGVACELNGAIALGQFFNHATHHRGQVHVMLSDGGAQPPALDFMRLLPV